ncbi:hypothetical protein C8F01DRAFT_1119483 [Mycena amicta]|nr:hypothetical protein C8F01DRAFT_1119483 [Mycena amicta]
MADAASLRTQIEHLTLAIAEHKRVLDEMQTNLDSLQKQLHAIPYPILTLPPEIVSQIFIHSIPRAGSSPGRLHAPTLPTQVCRVWRAIAISTPALWTSFNIYLPERGWPHLSQLTEMWLSRSGDLPLFVMLTGDHGCTKSSMTHGLVTTLKRYTRRIKRLSLNMAATDLAFLDTYAFKWDRLETLSYSLMYDGMPTNSPLFTLFNNAPSLRRVALRSMLPSFFDLRWASVVKFNGALYSCSQSLRIMQLLTNAENVELATQAYQNEREENPTPVVYQNVRRFCIRELGGPHEFSHMLQFFTFPQLDTLELLDEIDGDALEGFFVRSAPPLRKLVITLGSIFNTISGTVLQRLQSIVDLEFRSPSLWFFRDFFKEYTQDAGFLPNLERLSISCELRDAVSLDFLVMEVGLELRQRKKNLPNSKTLKWLRLHTEATDNMRYEYSKRRLAVYHELQSEGTEVHIVAGDSRVF